MPETSCPYTSKILLSDSMLGRKFPMQHYAATKISSNPGWKEAEAFEAMDWCCSHRGIGCSGLGKEMQAEGEESKSLSFFGWLVFGERATSTRRILSLISNPYKPLSLF